MKNKDIFQSFFNPIFSHSQRTIGKNSKTEREEEKEEEDKKKKTSLVNTRRNIRAKTHIALKKGVQKNEH